MPPGDPGDRRRGAEPVFERLDVVRWERCRVNAGDVDSEADLLDRVATTLEAVLASEADPERLLAVRVIVHGTTSLNDRLHADTERYVNEVRNLAIERGEDRLWIEKVEFQTRSARLIVLPDGPIEELREMSRPASRRPRRPGRPRGRAGRAEAEAAGRADGVARCAAAR